MKKIYQTMKKKSFKRSWISILLLLLVILATASYKRYRGSDADKGESFQVAKKQFVCSMHPQVIRDGPGDCPICGMFLIEKVDQDKNSFDTSLVDIVGKVNNSVLASVMTVTPEQTAQPLIIEASGIINYDPGKVHTVSASFGGLIERSFVKYQFQYVKKGQKIYEIYCPDIYTDRWNYVKMAQAYPDRDDLAGEALEWLKLLGLSKGQIDSLRRSVKPDYHLAVYSPAEGYAVSSDFDPESFFFAGSGGEKNQDASLAGTGSIGLNDGISIEKGEQLFKLIDMSALRVDLKIKTEDGSLLKSGQKVIITDAANPDREFEGRINQIDPLNGGIFQTVKVYITDKERFLLPGRQIKAQIMSGTRDGIWVPVSAVAELGQRRTVFVFDGNKFVAREIRTGVRSNDKIEILSGIDKNSIIAEKALLLIDSDGFIATN